MGKMNTAMRSFLCNRKRFADLFNGIMFQGKEVLKENDLLEASEQYSTVSDNPLERFRDIKMYLKTGGTLRILALENQNQVDYTMPYRCMQYDTLEYGRQLGELQQSNREKVCLNTSAERLCGISKSNRLVPVYTICLYHGEDLWDGPLSLRDMMNFGEDIDGMSNFFADYPMRLFCVNKHTDFSMFHTELGAVFTALNCRKNKVRLYATITENAVFRRMSSETIKVLSILLDAPRLWKERGKFMNINQNKVEEYDMCQAMHELCEDWRNEGLSQGLSQGKNMINTLVQKLLENNRLDDLKRAVADAVFQEQLLEEYKLKE